MAGGSNFFVGVPSSAAPFVDDRGIITQLWFRFLNSLWQQTNGSILNLVQTITPVGTNGDQTINTPTGRVNIAAGGTSVTVTNNLVTVDSVVFAIAAAADVTALVTSVVPSDGSFVINTVAVTADTPFNFLVCS